MFEYEPPLLARPPPSPKPVEEGKDLSEPTAFEAYTIGFHTVRKSVWECIHSANECGANPFVVVSVPQVYGINGVMSVFVRKGYFVEPMPVIHNPAAGDFMQFRVSWALPIILDANSNPHH